MFLYHTSRAKVYIFFYTFFRRSIRNSSSKECSMCGPRVRQWSCTREEPSPPPPTPQAPPGSFSGLLLGAPPRCSFSGSCGGQVEGLRKGPSQAHRSTHARTHAGRSTSTHLKRQDKKFESTRPSNETGRRSGQRLHPLRQGGRGRRRKGREGRKDTVKGLLPAGFG